MKHIKRLLITVILIVATIFTIITCNILFHEFNAKPMKSDAMIVLGCEIKGKIPSLMLEERLKKALELYNANYANYIIVSGGKGSNEIVSEASVMSGWLIKNGISADKILQEDRSHTTYENLKYSKVIMEKKEFSTAIIVSNGFHIFRSLRLAEKLGINANGAPAPTVFYLSFYFHCREILSVVKNFFLYG